MGVASVSTQKPARDVPHDIPVGATGVIVVDLTQARANWRALARHVSLVRGRRHDRVLGLLQVLQRIQARFLGVGLSHCSTIEQPSDRRHDSQEGPRGLEQRTLDRPPSLADAVVALTRPSAAITAITMPAAMPG